MDRRARGAAVLAASLGLMALLALAALAACSADGVTPICSDGGESCMTAPGEPQSAADAGKD